ncbi:type VII secretion system-associated protein [Saccharopolyspora sp. 7B]|uniref:type VII secretion system-associated protein n=1 Tax=Saccharopolyspora sp. 7B TaxID=2877240 RepID=UPI001CD5DE12|nr:type VII secretion system-associated protein [Saccharopolyspora sp. 7B]MCA1278620.1 type VII secretion system-associated protein [Saccharopolyspora sp. 7B]
MSSSNETPGTPVITASMREAARARAGGYLYVTDPAYDPDGDVPPHGIKGAFGVDENGDIGNFHPNPNYRPSRVEEAEPPAGLVDHGLRETLAGRFDQEQFLRYVAGAVLPVLVSEQGNPLLLDADDGVCLMTYSTPKAVPEDVRIERMYLPRVVPKLPTEASVVLTGTAGVQARYPVPDLVAAMRAAQMLLDDPEGGTRVGPPIWVEYGPRLVEAVGEETFAAAERALARWGTLGSALNREGARSAVLGIVAVEVLVASGVTDPDVLAAAAAFRGVEPRYAGLRERVTKVPDEGLPVAMLLRAAVSPEVPGDVNPELVFQDYSGHLNELPWQVRAIVLAHRVADLTSPFLPPERREVSRADLAGPLLSCAQDLPEALRNQVAELAGADPSDLISFRAAPRPVPAVASDDHAIERVRAATGLTGPADVADVGPAYVVRESGGSAQLHFVHKRWGTVTSVLDEGGAISDYCGRYELFSFDAAVLTSRAVAQAGAGSARTAPEPHERFTGSLLGGAAGDALGYALEFHDVAVIRQQHGPAGLTGPVLHGGVAPVSDGTQLMLFTVEGLIRAHVARRAQPADDDPIPEVQHAYQRWLHAQGRPWAQAGGPYAHHLQRPDGWLITNPGLFAQRSPGGTCLQAVENFARTHRFATPQHRLNDSKGCGGVVRAAPVAVWSHDPAEVFRVAVGTAALTHGHPSGFLSAGVLAVVVHQLIREVPLPDAVRTARELLVRWPLHEEQLWRLDAAVQLGGKGPVSPEEINAVLGHGVLAEEVLAIGLYAALATGDLRSALLLSVNHSGDSASTGMVCGNIAGALHGVEALPPEWLGPLELRDVVEVSARDAQAEFGPHHPTDPTWFQRYPGW